MVPIRESGHGVMPAAGSKVVAMVAREVEQKYDPGAAGRLPAPEAVKRSPLTARSPAAEVVLAYLRDQVTAIAHYDPLVRRDEPDAVHQMRVAGYTRGATAKTVILRWNGMAWTQVPSPSPGATFNYLSSVAATSTTNAWAVGGSDNGTLILHWNGTTWR